MSMNPTLGIFILVEICLNMMTLYLFYAGCVKFKTRFLMFCNLIIVMVLIIELIEFVLILIANKDDYLEEE
jgi:hypothetical protein